MTTATSISKAPVVWLTNGLRVANFSSPHEFNFEDGSVLEGCAPDRVSAGALERIDEERPWPGLPGVVAVVPRFGMQQLLWQLLLDLQNDTEVDVVLIPFPVLEALRSYVPDSFTGETGLEIVTKAATVSVKNRQTKEIYINRFCR